MSKPAAVLFDLDGTLLDTAPDFYVVLNRVLQEANQPAADYQLVRDTVSNGARALIMAAFNIPDTHPQFAGLLQKLLQYYTGHLAVKTQLFPGLNEFLLELEQRNIAWGIVTNKPSIYTNPILEQLNLSKRCSVAICPDQVQNKKPHPEPILKACADIGVSPDQTFYVGDHARDIESGRAAGSKTIAALWGYIPQEENTQDWQADFYVAQPEQLTDLFNAWW